MKNLNKLQELERLMEEASALAVEIYGESALTNNLFGTMNEVKNDIENIDDLNSEINPNNFHGQTFKSITSIDSAVEKLVGEEVIRFKETGLYDLKFETKNFVVEVEYSMDLYKGMTVQTHSIELK
jgi:hypothetical protein